MHLYDLNRMTTLGLNDIPLFIELCVLYGIYRLILTYGLIAKVAKVTNIKSDKTRFKFTHRTFDLIHYTFSTILGLSALYSQSYSHCFYYSFDCGNEFKQQIEPKGVCVMNVLGKMYYMLFTAYYAVDVFFLWTNNNNTWIMILHHTATLSLIFISVYIRTHVIGICVMLLHDAVDVPLYIGKFFTYLDIDHIQDISFLIFAVLSTWLRMICLPGIIYNGIINMTKQKPDHYHFYSIEVCMLFSLMICHVIWYIGVVRMLYSYFSMKFQYRRNENQ